MLNANKRDVKIKCRKFRNNGKATGVINRKNGDNISISVKISDLDKFLAKHGDHSDLEINLEGEVINIMGLFTHDFFYCNMKEDS